MKVMRVLCGLASVIGFSAQASEYFKRYDVNQPQIPKQQTQRALDYERAYVADRKERVAGFYNRFKAALGFKPSAQPRPCVAEYEAAFSAQAAQKKEPWNTPWYETRTYEEPLPVNVRKTLDAHQKELAEMGTKTVSSFTWLPGYVVKKGYGKHLTTSESIPSNSRRIRGAKVFTNVIKGQRNPTIYIPQKYEYVATDSEDNIKNEYIISEKIPLSDEPITKKEAKAIADIAYRTKWTDPQGDNFIKIAPGRIAIIDTEARFRPGLERNMLKYIISEQMRDANPSQFSPEATDYLKRKQMQLRDKVKGWYFRVPPSKKNFYSQMGL